MSKYIAKVIFAGSWLMSQEHAQLLTYLCIRCCLTNKWTHGGRDTISIILQTFLSYYPEWNFKLSLKFVPKAPIDNQLALGFIIFLFTIHIHITLNIHITAITDRTYKTDRTWSILYNRGGSLWAFSSKSANGFPRHKQRCKHFPDKIAYETV